MHAAQGCSRKARTRPAKRTNPAERPGTPNQAGRQTLLVVGLGGERQAAIPLASVARLEEFELSVVEGAAGSHVVQYRGEIMPLVDICRLLDGGDVPQHAASAALKVVVYTLEGRRYGLVVDSIHDTVETDVAPQRCTNRPGVLGSMVLRQKVTDLLDIPSVVARSGVVAFEAEEKVPA